MSLRLRDAYATLVVAAIALGYGLWLGGHALPGLHSARMMGLAVLLVGMLGCSAAGSTFETEMRRGGVYFPLVSVLGVVALVAAIATLASGSHTLLAILVGTVIALWVVATLRHLVSHPELPAHAPARPERELVRH